MNELKQLTVYVASDGATSENEIIERLAEKLAKEILEHGIAKVAYQFDDYKVYELSAWVPSHD